MSSELRRDSLEPEIQSLLERERSDPYGDPAGSRKAALARRLEHAALAIAVTGAAPMLGAAHATHATHATAEAARRAATGTLASAGAHTQRLLSWGLASKVGVASVLLAAGGGAGAVLEAHYGSPSQPSALVEPATIPASSSTLATPSLPSMVRENDAPRPTIPSVDIDSLPNVAASAGVAHPMVSTTPASSTTSLAHAAPTPEAEEVLLLKTAQAAVARGAYSAALATLTECASRFPNGKKVEERELLFVEALAGSGRRDEAAARASAFEARFPGSIFLPAVRAASSTKEP
jgi:hypothetical protein